MRRLPVHLLIVSLFSGLLMAQTKLLRFPDIHQDQIVFTYSGDLWLVSADGGTARRLTTHPGLELFAKFSRDGKSIAFTGQYDGDEQVYVVPVSGGQPRQLTYYPARGPLPPRWGYDHQVYGWSPEGDAVLFRSLRETWNLTDAKLYTVQIDGGLPEVLPMPVSGAGDFSPDGSKIVYSPLFRDFRTWKRYQGGWAQDLVIFDLETFQTENITDHPRTDRDPMWVDDKIYFASDRTGTLNLYSYDPESKEIRQLTESDTWDVRWPSAGPGGRIVYEFGGELYLYDLAEGESRKVSIYVPDDGLSRRPSRIKVADNIEDFELSPAGERALMVARGEVFSLPIEYGPTRNLTRTSGAHDRWARWSPDGRTIAFISDQDGEDELYLVAQAGQGRMQQITDGNEGMLYAPAWSPNSKKIAFSDKDGKLYVVDVVARTKTEIADEERGLIQDYDWAPDSAHLAFSLSDGRSGFRSIHIWEEKTGELHRVTSPLFNEYNPTWSPDSNYLYYLSDREFAPQIGAFEWNYVGNREAHIYGMALRKDVEALFPPRSDEVEIEEEKKEQKEKEGEKEEGSALESEEESAETEEAVKEEDSRADEKALTIDFDGLSERVVRFPIESDNYAGLVASAEHLIYLQTPAFYYGRGPERPPSLKFFSLKEREAHTLISGISGYAVSEDGQKVLVRQGSSYRLLPVKTGAEKEAKTVSTDGFTMDRIPAEEWAEVFDEVWRRFRDFFYVENMHGYNWRALRERYEPLLSDVAHRSDLNYVIGEMIGELNVSHAYIVGGDFLIPERPEVGLPGALFELDEQAGRYRIAKIFPGHNEEEIYRSPLTELGVEIAEGSYVLAIDGEELTAEMNPYQLLRFKSKHPVVFTVNDQPTEEGSRKVEFVPRTSETSLHYLDWVLEKRRRVEEATDGKVGYLHLPDMGANGIREFIKWFYGQIDREGLIIDVRNNGGGNVSQMLIERFLRELLALGYSRTSDHASTYPGTVFAGHLVTLLNENSASDGDIFPAMFKQAGLGPLIGKRSWGGVIGITNRGTLIDGGGVNVPEFGFASVQGEWIIEGRGVVPDIVVENTAEELLQGRDAQLERAISEIMTMIEAEPRSLPSKPPPPVKIP